MVATSPDLSLYCFYVTEVSGFISPPFNGASLKARVTLKASATPKVREILRDLLPRQSARAAAPQSDWWGEGRQSNTAIWESVHVILHVLEVCVLVWM